jgi:hypothetical protein
MRYKVTTVEGEQFYVDAVAPGGVRDEVELRDDEIESIEGDPEPLTYYEEGPAFDPDWHLNYADWISDAVRTEAIVEFEKWFSDFDLGFYVREDTDVRYYRESGSLVFDCFMEGYDLVEMGGGYPEGLGDLTSLSVEKTTHQVGYDIQDVLYVDVSFENEIEE